MPRAHLIATLAPSAILMSLIRAFEMRRRCFQQFHLVSLLVAGIVAALAALAVQPVILGYTGAYCLAPRCYCDGPVFEAAVHQGPDTGLEVEGQIKYAVNPDGSFTSQIIPS